MPFTPWGNCRCLLTQLWNTPSLSFSICLSYHARITCSFDLKTYFNTHDIIKSVPSRKYIKSIIQRSLSGRLLRAGIFWVLFTLPSGRLGVWNWRGWRHHMYRNRANRVTSLSTTFFKTSHSTCCICSSDPQVCAHPFVVLV